MNKVIRLPFARIIVTTDLGQAILPGNCMFASKLIVTHIRDGVTLEERDTGSGVVTLVGATLMAADGTNSTATLKQMVWHDSGSGNLAVDLGQTSLQIPLTSFQVGGRVSGTLSSVGNVYLNTGTIQYNAIRTVNEWGLFNASTSGTMFDRKLLIPAFSVLVNDQLQFAYQLTILPGG